jgi:hypothetical protein
MVLSPFRLPAAVVAVRVYGVFMFGYALQIQIKPIS